ncbi:MAG: LemA family protein, partial [Actinobacteria bacterium]|nr:LemA family protein [Actinomycetota bacterium]
MTLLIVIAIVVVLAIIVVVLYNNLVKLRNLVDNAWAQIEVQLTRRADLIPNLVNTVKGYAEHERETLDAVISARGAAMGASTPAAAAAAEGPLTAALGRLFAVAEAY